MADFTEHRPTMVLTPESAITRGGLSARALLVVAAFDS